MRKALVWSKSPPNTTWDPANMKKRTKKISFTELAFDKEKEQIEETVIVPVIFDDGSAVGEDVDNV